MSLIDDLAGTFGLTPQQAQGAIGAIGRAAQGRLPPALFSELGQLIPGLDAMIQQAPAAGGGLFGMLGGSLGEAAALAGVFRTLGIDGGKIMPIAQTVLGFVRQNGSPALQQAVNGLAAKLGLG